MGVDAGELDSGPHTCIAWPFIHWAISLAFVYLLNQVVFDKQELIKLACRTTIATYLMLRKGKQQSDPHCSEGQMSEVRVLTKITLNNSFRTFSSFWWCLAFFDIFFFVALSNSASIFSWWIGGFHFNEIHFACFHISASTFCALPNKQLLIPSSQMFSLENSRFTYFLVKWDEI